MTFIVRNGRKWLDVVLVTISILTIFLRFSYCKLLWISDFFEETLIKIKLKWFSRWFEKFCNGRIVQTSEEFSVREMMIRKMFHLERSSADGQQQRFNSSRELLLLWWCAVCPKICPWNWTLNLPPKSDYYTRERHLSKLGVRSSAQPVAQSSGLAAARSWSSSSLESLEEVKSRNVVGSWHFLQFLTFLPRDHLAWTPNENGFYHCHEICNRLIYPL